MDCFCSEKTYDGVHYQGLVAISKENNLTSTDMFWAQARSLRFSNSMLAFFTLKNYLKTQLNGQINMPIEIKFERTSDATVANRISEEDVKKILDLFSENVKMVPFNDADWSNLYNLRYYKVLLKN